eukprot:10968835-Alexandrium_andersonii.AAC.1
MLPAGAALTLMWCHTSVVGRCTSGPLGCGEGSSRAGWSQPRAARCATPALCLLYTSPSPRD